IFRTAVGKVHDLAPDLDSRIARALDRAVETARSEARSAAGELHTGLARLTEIQATLAGLEGSLLAYLGAFDVRLERERARVLAKLGEELAEGLSRRERKRLVGRLSSARDADPGHEVSSSAPWSPPLPLPPEARPESGPPDPAPPGPSRPSMRPGLLTELLGEEPPARPEPVVPRMLRPGGEVQTTDEERTEQAPRGQALDSGPEPAGPAPDEVKTTSFICPTCGFSARSAAGLASHRRRHA
ncbi:MAG: hypothetical protein M3O70_10075, partial [Actinomycetota bacterium]|nr:hypothetical protein [Actinomycetota bacterium]